jgi:hypothetical protein
MLPAEFWGYHGSAEVWISVRLINELHGPLTRDISNFSFATKSLRLWPNARGWELYRYRNASFLDLGTV